MTTKKAFTLGCGGILVFCVAMCLIIWLIQLPRLTADFEDKVANGVATLIAEDIDPHYSPEELQRGQDVRISFRALNGYMLDSVDHQNVFIEFTSTSEIVWISGAGIEDNFDFNVEMVVVPEATEDGRLRLRPADGQGWFGERLLTVIGVGLETTINDWLDRNNLILTDVTLAPGTMILSVEGE